MRIETLFTDGAWSVALAPPRSVSRPGWSGIAHACGYFKTKHFTAANLIHDTATPLCAKCHAPVPDGILGLWTLHNWDQREGLDVPDNKWMARPGQLWEYSPGNGRSG